MVLMRNQKNEDNKTERQHGVCSASWIRRVVIARAGKWTITVHAKILVPAGRRSTSQRLVAEVVHIVLTRAEFSNDEESRD